MAGYVAAVEGRNPGRGQVGSMSTPFSAPSCKWEYSSAYLTHSERRVLAKPILSTPGHNGRYRNRRRETDS